MTKRILLLAALGATLVPATAAANPTGMTWATYGHDDATGTDAVSCHGGDSSCDAYGGDTRCEERLPLLCINVDGSANPGATTSTYTQWAAGNIATSRPVRGTALTSLALADRICEATFGEGWRMAEFHDGWGWGFVAFGHVRADSRFWVSIDDQPANCWD